MDGMMSGGRIHPTNKTWHTVAVAMVGLGVGHSRFRLGRLLAREVHAQCTVDGEEEEHLLKGEKTKGGADVRNGSVGVAAELVVNGSASGTTRKKQRENVHWQIDSD